jgi:hypothetical protein
MLLAGVACLKHEGFHEECEWRAGIPDAKEKVVTSGIPIRPGY